MQMESIKRLSILWIHKLDVLMDHLLLSICMKELLIIFSSIWLEELVALEIHWIKYFKIAISAVLPFTEVQSIGHRPRLERVYCQPILRKIFLPTGQRRFYSTVMVLFIKATQRNQFHTKTLNCILEEVQTLALTSPISITAITSARPTK